MRIVILGWGSLIWDHANLPVTGKWQPDGPILPIEFSRVSRNLRLTLVIDRVNGTPVPTQYIASSRTNLEDAIADLQLREELPSSRNVGFVNLVAGNGSARVESVGEVIRNWASGKNTEAVIWTDLPSNFETKCGSRFTAEAAVAYLQSLRGTEFDRAMEYIRRAPVEVETTLRTHLRQVRALSGHLK